MPCASAKQRWREIGIVIERHDDRTRGRAPRPPASASRCRRCATSPDAPFHELRGLRAPGTGLPRRIARGTWRYRGGRDLAALYRRKPAVIVSLQDAPFARLLVSADHAEDVAARIRAAT